MMDRKKHFSLFEKSAFLTKSSADSRFLHYKSIYIVICKICKRVLPMSLSQKSGENILKTDLEDMKSGEGGAFSTICCFLNLH